jgi:hypothetical protein
MTIKMSMLEANSRERHTESLAGWWKLQCLVVDFVAVCRIPESFCSNPLFLFTEHNHAVPRVTGDEAAACCRAVLHAVLSVL